MHVPVSYNFIHKGPIDGLLRAVESVHTALYRPGDECVIVDTGSTNNQFKRLRKAVKQFPDCRLIDRRDLAENLRPLAEKYLPENIFGEYEEYLGTTTGILNFAAARNIALDASRNDLIFWMDSDDVLKEEEPGHLRQVVDDVYGKNAGKISCLFLDYDYAFSDEDGELITRLRRERFFRKSEMHWRGRCHEVAVYRDGNEPYATGFFENLKSRIVHTEDRKPHRISDIRNYLILAKEVDGAGAAVDPRTVFYLGNAARGLRMFQKALSCYEWFDYRSGSSDDRHAAHYYRGGMYLDPDMRRPLDALEAFQEAAKIKPRDPRAYYGMSRCYCALSRWEDALHWYDVGSRYTMDPQQVFSYDPTHISFHPHVIAAKCWSELEQPEGVIRAVEAAVRARPNLEESKLMARYYNQWLAGKRLTDALLTLGENSRGNANAIRLIRNALAELGGAPPQLEKRGLTAPESPDPRPDLPNIAIWCGPSGEPWGPASAEGGIGGSEKMVILLSDALAKTGLCSVSVYADVPFPQRGVHKNGVIWEHWGAFDEERPRHALIFWRTPSAVAQVQSPAKYRVIWNHDVQSPDRYPPDVVASADLIQFQSEFHAAPVKALLSEKVWVARNAVAPLPKGPPRDPYQVVYCSSPDRGLRTATEIVKRAREIEPRISLVVSYGVTPWARRSFAKNNHRYIPDLGRDASTDLYERDVHAALDSIEAVNLGRIGFTKMAALMQSSGVWLYPTRFPEISCMSAMEAQQSGTVVLATNYGALAETILPAARKICPPLRALPKSGDIPDQWYEQAAFQLVEACRLAETERDALTAVAAEAGAKFSIADLATAWTSKLGLEPRNGGEDSAQVSSVRRAEFYERDHHDRTGPERESGRASSGSRPRKPPGKQSRPSAALGCATGDST